MYIFFVESSEKCYVEVGKKVWLDDMINIELYEVFNFFVVRPFQYIETSDIEWLK